MQQNELQKLKVFAFGLKKPSIQQTTCRLWNPQWHQTEDMDSFQNCGEIEDGHPTRIQWIFEENAAPFGCLEQHGAASDSILRTLKTPWAPCGTANHLAAGSLGQMEVPWLQQSCSVGLDLLPPLVHARKGCAVAGRRGPGEGSWLCWWHVVGVGLGFGI